MDPITLFSVLYKVASFSNEKQNKIFTDFSKQSSRTEIIEMYRLTMKDQKIKNFEKK